MPRLELEPLAATRTAALGGLRSDDGTTLVLVLVASRSHGLGSPLRFGVLELEGDGWSTYDRSEFASGIDRPCPGAAIGDDRPCLAIVEVPTSMTATRLEAAAALGPGTLGEVVGRASVGLRY